MKLRRIFTFFLSLVLCLGLVMPASAASSGDALGDTADYLTKTVPNPKIGSVGGEWAVIGLARGGYSVPSSYYGNVESYVKSCKGVLHRRKYTEYSRVILALTAIGKDPRNVAGYDLTAPLNNFDKTVWQGINGPIWALIALDSGNYPCSVRQKYIDYILGEELSGGGWAISGNNADADITGMALQALSKYQKQKKVKAATDRALTWISNNQNADGSFSTLGLGTCESTAQIIMGLTELGISLNDSRFVKNGHSALDGLMTYYVGGGSFAHVLDGSGNKDSMATEQGFCALVAADRAAKGQSSFYRMNGEAGNGSLTDIEGHKNQKAIMALVEKEIINGMGDGTFAPDKTMTRAEFCTITVKALGLAPKANKMFTDVPASRWYAGFVGTASSKGIVNGVGNRKFNPDGTITRQEAAAMVARAAKALGLKTTVSDEAAILAKFSDGSRVADWAKGSVAYCCDSGILETSGTIQPTKAILRCEIAQMIYNMLHLAGKIR